MQKIVEFILELDKLKSVNRKCKPLRQARYENPAEHSWQIAFLAAALGEYAAESVNLDRVIRMLLVHDVGEIDTGDRMVFAEGGWAEHEERERAAVRRIFGILPPAKAAEFLELWEEFAAAQSAEARFARAVDRAMPALLNLANAGQSWKENGIRYEQVMGRLAAPIAQGCPALWAYLEPRLAAGRESGLFAG